MKRLLLLIGLLGVATLKPSGNKLYVTFELEERKAVATNGDIVTLAVGKIHWRDYVIVFDIDCGADQACPQGHVPILTGYMEKDQGGRHDTSEEEAVGMISLLSRLHAYLVASEEWYARHEASRQALRSGR